MKWSLLIVLLLLQCVQKLANGTYDSNSNCLQPMNYFSQSVVLSNNETDCKTVCDEVKCTVAMQLIDPLTPILCLFSKFPFTFLIQTLSIDRLCDVMRDDVVQFLYQSPESDLKFAWIVSNKLQSENELPETVLYRPLGTLRSREDENVLNNVIVNDHNNPVNRSHANVVQPLFGQQSYFAYPPGPTHVTFGSVRPNVISFWIHNMDLSSNSNTVEQQTRGITFSLFKMTERVDFTMNSSHIVCKRTVFERSPSTYQQWFHNKVTPDIMENHMNNWHHVVISLDLWPPRFFLNEIMVDIQLKRDEGGREYDGLTQFHITNTARIAQLVAWQWPLDSLPMEYNPSDYILHLRRNSVP